MSEYFEIAYAAATGSLCLFTGTGFSMAVTDKKAPTWQALLESVCVHAHEPDKLKAALFPASGKNPLTLEEAAQVVSIELFKKGKSIHDEIAVEIGKLKIQGDNTVIANFLSRHSFEVVTTNYDKLMEELAGPIDCHSLTPGLPIPRSPKRVQVYHVHGSIDSPKDMVVTSDDYFKFLNSESYFSRKLSTVLHENTVVIIGYSLGDTNLKAILSDYKGFSKNHSIGSNLFLVSLNKVDQHVKDYYAHCYGIRVLDELTTHQFFTLLTAAIPEAEKCVADSVRTIQDVVHHNYQYTEAYLGLKNAFFEIIASIGATGFSVKNPAVGKVLSDVLKTKIRLTQVPGAWVQYEHPAQWLVYLATTFELGATSFTADFLDACLKSMGSMGKSAWGRSWQAYSAWRDGWPKITASNRNLIRTHIKTNTNWPDAWEVVDRI